MCTVQRWPFEVIEAEYANAVQVRRLGSPRCGTFGHKIDESDIGSAASGKTWRLNR